MRRAENGASVRDCGCDGRWRSPACSASLSRSVSEPCGDSAIGFAKPKSRSLTEPPFVTLTLAG